MATVSRTYLVDDLDGSTEDIETVQFNAEGKEYEIDLSATNAARLRDKLQRFVDAATPIKAKAAPVKRTRGKVAAVATHKEDTSAIRAWAEQAGLAVSSRGRISKEIKEAYDAR